MADDREDIEAAGLSAGAIYGYFDGKRDLAVAAARRTLQGRLGDLRDRTDRPLSPSGMLRVIADGFRRDDVPTGLIVQLWGEAVTDPEFLGIAAEAFAELGVTFTAELAAWARDRGRVDADAWAADMLPVLLALGQGLILQSALMPGFDRDRYLAAVDALFA